MVSIEIATSASFASTVVDEGGLTGLSYPSATPLANDQLYYWRVTASNGDGAIAASNAGISFTTPPVPPRPGVFGLVLRRLLLPTFRRWRRLTGKTPATLRPTTARRVGKARWLMPVRMLVCPSLGRREVGNLHLFPNPASGNVTIGWPGFFNARSVEITDPNGRVVRVVPVENATELRLDITRLRKGLYFVTLVSATSSHTTRLLLR